MLQNHLPRVDTICSGLVPIISNINRERALIGLPTGQTDEDISPAEVPLSQMTLAYVKGYEN